MSGIIQIFAFLLSNFSSCDIRWKMKFSKVPHRKSNKYNWFLFFVHVLNDQPRGLVVRASDY